MGMESKGGGSGKVRNVMTERVINESQGRSFLGSEVGRRGDAFHLHQTRSKPSFNISRLPYLFSRRTNGDHSYDAFQIKFHLFFP